jgi:hypothetical protein
MWCRVLARFAGQSDDFGASPAVRDALISVGVSLVTTPDAAYWWCSALCNLASTGRARQVFGAPQLADAICCVSSSVDARAAKWFCGAICNLTTANNPNKQLLGTDGIRDALVRVAANCSTATGADASESTEWWCRSICNLTGDFVQNKRIFGTALPMRDAIISMCAHATTGDSAGMLCRAVVSIASYTPAREVLCSTSMKTAIAGLKPVADASGGEIAQWWSHAKGAVGA